MRRTNPTKATGAAYSKPAMLRTARAEMGAAERRGEHAACRGEQRRYEAGDDEGGEPPQQQRALKQPGERAEQSRQGRGDCGADPDGDRGDLAGEQARQRVRPRQPCGRSANDEGQHRQRDARREAELAARQAAQQSADGGAENGIDPYRDDERPPVESFL